MSCTKYIPPFRRNRSQAAFSSEPSANPELTASTQQQHQQGQCQESSEKPGPDSIDESGRTALSSDHDDSRPLFTVDPRVSSIFPDNFFNWVQPVLPHFDKVSARYISSKVATFPLTQQQISWELEYRPFIVILDKLIDACCQLVMNESEKATRLLDETERDFIRPAVAQSLIDREQAQGFRHLSQGLLAFLLSLDRTKSKSQLQVLEQILAFQRGRKLSPGATVVLRGAKAYFGWNARGKVDREKLVEDLQKLCDENPDSKNCEWRLLLNDILRRIRLFYEDRFAPPSEYELMNLVECLRLNSDHVLVKLAVSMFVGDNWKCGGWKPARGDLRLGEHLVFSSEEDVEQYVNDTAIEVLEKLPHLEKVLQDLNELFTKLLTGPLRNMELGKWCLLQSLHQKPDGSKINHQIAIFLLAHEKNFAEGLAYAKRAIELDHCNFAAITDTIKLMMGDPLGNQKEIDYLLLEQGNNSAWGELELSELFILEAVFSFMLKDPERCVVSILTVFRLECSSIKYLKKIAAETHRYGWDQAKIDPVEMGELLLKFMEKRSCKDDLRKSLEMAVITLGIVGVDRETTESGTVPGGGGSGPVSHKLNPGSRRTRRRRQLAADADDNWRENQSKSSTT